MIQSRIRSVLENHIRKNQNGFRPGENTTKQILALRRIIEGVKDTILSTIVPLTDFKKAFDTLIAKK